MTAVQCSESLVCFQNLIAEINGIVNQFKSKQVSSKLKTVQQSVPKNFKDLYSKIDFELSFDKPSLDECLICREPLNDDYFYQQQQMHC